MLHAQIAARAFNTPLLVEPSKAVAFLSGLGPRILGGKVALNGDHSAEGPPTHLPALPSQPRASALTLPPRPGPYGSVVAGVGD